MFKKNVEFDLRFGEALASYTTSTNNFRLLYLIIYCNFNEETIFYNWLMEKNLEIINFRMLHKRILC